MSRPMMSASVSTPLRSIYELHNLFTDLRPVRDVLADALNDWDPPQLVVLGAEGSGKSSLLERLSLLPIFPRCEGKSPRRPLRLELRHAPDSAPLTLQVRDLKTGAVKCTYRTTGSGSEVATCRLMQVCCFLKLEPTKCLHSQLLEQWTSRSRTLVGIEMSTGRKANWEPGDSLKATHCYATTTMLMNALPSTTLTNQ